MLKKLFLLFLALGLTATLGACDNQGSTEQAGEKMDTMTEETQQTMEQAPDQSTEGTAEDSGEMGGEAAEQTTEGTAESMGESGDEAMEQAGEGTAEGTGEQEEAGQTAEEKMQ